MTSEKSADGNSRQTAPDDGRQAGRGAVIKLKNDAWRANMDIPRHGLAIFTFGNVSAYDPELGLFAIKPSGVPYDELTPEHMVVLDLDGDIAEGSLNPSSDTKTHQFLYRHFPEIRGIVHTHSAYATSWAQSGRAMPVYGTTHADHSPTAVPCTRVMTEEAVKGDYELETGRQITSIFEELSLDYRHCPMVLVAGHGPFTWGISAGKALYHAAVLEQMAQMAWLSESLAALGKARASGAVNAANEAVPPPEPQPPLPPLPEYIIQKHFMRKHGPGAYYGQK